jgi:pyruvate/2-oxoglutarate dehydrogenase complex dihydrolipoamide dehydrogenase (E3) component
MDFDFLIIGGGSAGYAAARTASALNLKTCVVDGADELGGLCILRGCMPSKTLLATANRATSVRRAKEFGLRAGALEVRGDEILERKRRLIGEFADYRRGQLEGGKFELVRGTAAFVDANSVEVVMRGGGSRRITARSFLLATGSYIGEPPLAARTDVGFWTTDDVLDAADVPESVLVLGGGATAVEFASYYAGLGRKVTLIQRSARLLGGMDADVADALADGMRANGVKIFTGTKLLRAEQTQSGRRVIFEHDGGEKVAEAERIIVALGRVPGVRGLGLEAAGVAVERGRPAMHATQQTSQAHIFAAGDVAGPYEIVHVAIQQGEIAARNAARILGATSGKLEATDYRLKLSAIFSEPEVAACGATERELREGGVAFRAASHPFADHGKSQCIGETHGFVKLIADAGSGELLGGAVVGPHASELIHEIIVALRFRATARQLAETPHYHPTLSEIWTYPAEELM